MRNKPVLVELLTKPGCHLCDDARAIIQATLEWFQEESLEVSFVEKNIFDSAELLAEFSEDIPVVLIDGRRHSFWHVDEARFKTAVKKRAKRLF